MKKPQWDGICDFVVVFPSGAYTRHRTLSFAQSRRCKDMTGVIYQWDREKARWVEP